MIWFLNLLNIFAIIIINKIPVTIKAILAITPPNTPAALKPAYVAILIPIGPGVVSEIAIMSIKVALSNHVYLSAKLYKKGKVANPPPTENEPIIKNSINRMIKIMLPPFCSYKKLIQILQIKPLRILG